MKTLVTLVGVFLSILAAPIGQAAGFIVVSDQESIDRPVPPPWPGPGPRPPRIRPPERHFPFAPLELASVRVDTKIKDQFATTTIEEEFYNPNPRPVEGTFMLPLPKGAHINKFAMEIGGKTVEAELLDAEKARRLYEDIVRRVKDPALLEYADQDLLKARIFPIEANGRKKVTVSYTALLKADSGLVQYGLPLSGARFSASPIKTLGIKVELEGPRPLKTIYSPSHNIEVVRHGPDRATAGFEANQVSAEADFQLLFACEKNELGFSVLTERAGTGEDGYFLLLASPGFEGKDRRVLPKDVAFVLDTSGSMAGAKLEQAKKALLFCVENLNESDQFEVIRFATETEPLFGKLADSSKENRSRANEFIRQLKPLGGTAIDEALRKALSLRPGKEDRPFIIVFLTDGRPTVGATDEGQILAGLAKASSAKQSNTRVFCFGIGTDVNTHLLDKITDQTRAFSQYVLPEEDIEVKVSTFFSKIKDPLLSNLQLRTSGPVRLTKLYPSDLPDLFTGDQLVVLGRYDAPGPSTIILEGSAQGEQKRFEYKAEFKPVSREHPFIPQLWATRRVGYLLDQIRLHGENQELRQEVTELARQYGIVTPYTAYLILEDESRRAVPLAAQSLRRLSEDAAAQETARRFYATANKDKSGDGAVGAARYGLALRQADNAQALSLGNQEAQRGFIATVNGPAASFAGRANRAQAPEGAADYSQQNQFVNGRNFFLNGKQWIDSTVQSQANAPRVQVKFNSTEYFAFLREHPTTAPWLALGQNVQFAFQGKVYEIVD